MGEVAVPLGVAALGLVATVVASLLTRTAGSEDRKLSVLDMEVKYLSERLDKERGRTDALEAEVQECERSRAEDRRKFRDEIDDLRRVVRRLSDQRGTEGLTDG